MKNSKTLIIIVVLFIAGSIVGLSLTGNRFNKSNTGTFTLTGIPSQYNRKYAYLMGSNADYAADNGYVADIVAVFGGILMVDGAMKFPQIKGGSVTLPLRYADISGLGNLVSYRRSDTLGFYIYIYDQETVELSRMDDWICNIAFNSVDFLDGHAKRAWNAADDVYERR